MSLTKLCVLTFLVALLCGAVGYYTLYGQSPDDPHKGQPDTCHRDYTDPVEYIAKACHCKKECDRDGNPTGPEDPHCKVYCRKDHCHCKHNCDS